MSVRHALTALVLAAASGLAVTGCGGSGGEGAPAAKIEVVAAFYPLQEAAEAIGGDRVRVTNLTPVGGQPHDLQPSAEGLAAMRRAKVVLSMGSAFQPAVTEAVGALPASVERVDLLSIGDLRPAPKRLAGTRGPIDGGAGQGSDPHTWVSPPRFMAIVEAIRGALVKADPAGKADYEKRADAYLGTLRALAAEYDGGLGSCKGKVLLTTHAAFGYLAAEHGLEQVVAAGISPAAEPDPASLAATGRFAKGHDGATLFFATPVPSRLASTVAAATGGETATLNPVEGLTQDALDRGDDYVSLMRANLGQLTEALDCTPAT